MREPRGESQTPMQWLEISMTVTGELAEAVAEVLSRFAQGGVMMEQGIRQDDDKDVGAPDGPVTVRAYLPVDDELPEKHRELEAGLHYLGMIQPMPVPETRTIAAQNWMESWRQHYRPIAIGRRLMVIPAWLDSTEPGRIAVKIDPGMAFGTGTHPSTQLCLGFLDNLTMIGESEPDGQAARRPARFIDLGCGSGILAIAAVKLGVEVALGVDTDAAAIQNARENAQMNEVGAGLLLEVGSLAEIRRGLYPFRSAPLVAVNILAPVIVQLLGEGLAEILEPGGRMILAGILSSQAVEVESAARRSGLLLQEVRDMGEWVALAVTR